MKQRLTVLVLALAGLLLAAPAAGANWKHGKLNPTPLIFVHGGAGSGAQFESQALRFTSNGYPSSYVRVLEYDSTFSVNTTDQVLAKLDALVAQVKQETGKSKVDIAGHSLGTTLMHSYLATPTRRQNVAHYVNIDGRTASAPPGGVPTLAIWAGRGTPGRSIVGATNVTVPNQTHVQSATSPETFKAMFKFLTGRDPAHGIVRERCITLEGRAQLFPQNTGVGDRTLQIWEVKGSTGQRKHKSPVATLDIADDGSWGPVHGLRSGAHYEFALVAAGADHPSPVLRAVRAQRPPGAAADLRAERRSQPADRAQPAPFGADHRSLQGVLGGPGRRERPAVDQRDERDQRGYRADRQARDRGVRV